MYCKYCGTGNKDDATFCKGCGRQISPSRSGEAKGADAAFSGEPFAEHRPRRPRWLPVAVAACVAVAAIVVGIFAYLGIAEGGKLDAEKLYEVHAQVDEDVDSIEESYRNDDGYHSPEDVDALLADVEEYGRSHPEDIIDVENNGESVCFEFSDGALYVFTPTVEGMLAGSGESHIMTFEPYWTNVKNVTSLHIESNQVIDGFQNVSRVDGWAHRIADEVAGYDFSPQDNRNDSQVTLDSLRQIGGGKLVVYFGHGGYSDRSGPFLTMGEKVDKTYWTQHYDEFQNGELIWCSGDDRVGVSSAFFSDGRNFSDDSLEDTDILLIACHALEDDRLSDALIGCGARVVTGFDESVTIQYGLEMLNGLLGIDEGGRGLIDYNDYGQYLTFGESLENAKRRYGEEDPYKASGTPARCFCRPSDVADEARLTDEVAEEYARLVDYAAKLGVQNYQVEYQYRARGYANDPSFEWVVSDDLPDGAVVGTQIADYDGDGDNELLAVLWRNDTIDFDMYEVEGGTVKLAASMGDIATLAFPIRGNGTLDVVIDDSGALFMQWWEHTAPVASVHDWSVMRIDYDGGRLVVSDSATVAGTGKLSLEELRSDMARLGLSADYVPDEDFGQFTFSSIAELDSSLKLVTRATAWVDDEAVGTTAYREMQNGSSAWGDLKYLGNFRIGPNTPVWSNGGGASNTSDGDEASSANASSGGESVAGPSDDGRPPSGSRNSASEQDLRAAVSARAAYDIQYFYYGDFDRDGTQEAFAIAAANDGGDYVWDGYEGYSQNASQIWYADASETRLLETNTGSMTRGVESGSSGSFLVVENYAGGSGSSSVVYTVKDGKPVKMDISPAIGGFKKVDGADEFCAYENVFSVDGGHTYRWHYFSYDPSTATFSVIRTQMDE